MNDNNESTIINPRGDQCRLIFRFARNAVRLKSRGEGRRKKEEEEEERERDRTGAYLDVSRVKSSDYERGQRDPGRVPGPGPPAGCVIVPTRGCPTHAIIQH